MLPSIQQFNEFDLSESFLPICAAGFEDRAGAIFEELDSENRQFEANQAISIRYLPYLNENDEERTTDGLNSIGIPQKDITWVDFDKTNPQSFEPRFRKSLEATDEEHVLIDISAMSKFLIILCLEILAEKGFDVTIFYAEAEKYMPTETDYQEKKLEADGPDETPAFLTSDIFDILTCPALSSTAMGGQPTVAIMFPTFNHQEMMALANELSPHLLIAIEGIPHLPEDRWRKEAIAWLNQEAKSRVRTNHREASTFNYTETYNVLWDIYTEYSDAYRLVLAPTGSKLQTVATSLFRRANPDVQIVYPVTKKFPGTYTEGWKETWGIHLGKIDKLIQDEKPDAVMQISNLEDKIQAAKSDIEPDKQSK